MYPEFEGHPLLKDYPATRVQPLVPYRTEEEAGLPLGKQPPFRADEGMSFGRKFEWTYEDGTSEASPRRGPHQDGTSEAPPRRGPHQEEEPR